MAEGGGLLNRYTLQRRIEGSNPSVSASRLTTRVKADTFAGNAGIAVAYSRLGGIVSRQGHVDDVRVDRDSKTIATSGREDRRVPVSGNQIAKNGQFFDGDCLLRRRLPDQMSKKRIRIHFTWPKPVVT